ncbi:MAG: hypothetical protein RLZZ63_278 [Gemmatimonadota bacterium]|jgi:hypothetical protein
MPELALPDFIRGTRSVGELSTPGSDHERVMRPLRAAQQEARGARTVEAQCEAFAPAELEQAWRALITEFAAERHPRSAPDRRALTDELTQLGDAVWATLAELTVAANWARVAPHESAGVAAEARTRWIAAVRALFTAVDRWWGAIVPVLAEDTGRRGAFWRRVLQRSA